MNDGERRDLVQAAAEMVGKAAARGVVISDEGTDGLVITDAYERVTCIRPVAEGVMIGAALVPDPREIRRIVSYLTGVALAMEAAQHSAFCYCGTGAQHERGMGYYCQAEAVRRRKAATDADR